MLDANIIILGILTSASDFWLQWTWPLAWSTYMEKTLYTLIWKVTTCLLISEIHTAQYARLKCLILMLSYQESCSVASYCGVDMLSVFCMRYVRLHIFFHACLGFRFLLMYNLSSIKVFEIYWSGLPWWILMR